MSSNSLKAFLSFHNDNGEAKNIMYEATAITYMETYKPHRAHLRLLKVKAEEMHTGIGGFVFD